MISQRNALIRFETPIRGVPAEKAFRSLKPPLHASLGILCRISTSSTIETSTDARSAAGNDDAGIPADGKRKGQSVK
ncbi:hypothetical protein EYF80_004430 [Liparis tanakae]|uniref:Uncharacterized protein n=1 Tax=Liparis tanakae TaxID=230148 RepID=A0A4Z2J6W4_9TELE|nr:hypothetical protein EYF80_004430 [Liparis tanakae]